MTQVKRSAGQSAIASAAYRAGEKLYSERYGEYSDYTKKGGVRFTEILLPPHAPPEYADRQTLWNAVEEAEKHPQSQLAYSFDIALQNEFSLEENIALAKQFLLEQFVSRGMIVDLAIHDPEKEGGVQNPHFHVLCPIRPLDATGAWGAKQHRVYELDEDGNRIRDEACNYVFNAVPTTDWGRPETLEHWREQWAAMCNAKFAEKGISERIDHRTLEAQGVDALPTIHEGPTVRAMEKKGIPTDVGSYNRMIKTVNGLTGKIRKALAAIREVIAELKAERERMTAPTLFDCLSAFYQGRNEYATQNFGYGANKAKAGNLKKLSRDWAVLQERGLSTVEDLERYSSAVSGKNTDLADKERSIKKRIGELSDLLRHVENHERYKPLEKELNAIKWKGRKEKFKAEHDSELTMLYMAKRVLKKAGYGGEDSAKAWRAEIDELTTEHKTIKAEHSAAYADVRELAQIAARVREGKKQLEDTRTVTHTRQQER